MLFDGLATLVRQNAEQLFLAIAVVIFVGAAFTPGALTKVLTIGAGLLLAGMVVFNPEIIRGLGNAIAGVLPQ